MAGCDRIQVVGGEAAQGERIEQLAACGEIAPGVEQDAAPDDAFLGHELNAEVRHAHVDTLVGYAAVEAVVRMPDVAQTIDLRSRLQVERVQPVVAVVRIVGEHVVLGARAPRGGTGLECVE